MLQASLMHDQEPKFWNLVPDTSDQPNIMYLVRLSGTVTGQEQGLLYEGRAMHPFLMLSCQVLCFDGLNHNFNNTQWHPIIDLGTCSMFLG
jgi:hypothetical protein